MITRLRGQSSAAPLGLLGFLLVLLFLVAVQVSLADVAAAQEDEPPDEAGQPAAGDAVCAATGYLAGSAGERTELQGQLSERSVHAAAGAGVPLEPGQTWVVPDGSQPIVVVDSTVPLPDAVVSVALGGREFEVASGTFEEPRDRFVTNVTMPHLGPTVRSLGLSVGSGPCQTEVALSVDRSVWSTLVGAPAVVMTVLFGLLTVLVARLRKGGWWRRFGFAAPFGLIAGLGQAVVLLEAGVVSPFAAVPWWLPVAGVGLAAVLPLTRLRRRAAPAGAAAEPSLAWQVPVHAPLAGYRIDELVARTEVAEIYRATRVRVDALPTGEPALVKVASAQRYGEPAVRLRLEREAAVLAGRTHPNLLRLRETVPAAGAGPPTLVFEDVAGAPLQRLLEGPGSLTGPQAVNVVLGVLAGLTAVHAREVVHRDVRPENVWLAADGRVLLAGFELACSGMEHPLAPEGVEPYASPEQRAGRVLDGRSDLWACGVLLGALLTGQAPARAVDPAVAGREPSTVVDGLPEPLAAVLARALAEDPADRPASAEQLAAQLREAAGEAFGVDWTSRGALAGALVAHGAIGAAAGGYAVAGGATVVGAGGTAGAGAGGGALGSAALGVGPGTLGAAGVVTGGPGVVSVATSAVPAVPAGGAAAAGPAGALVNAAIAIAAGVAAVAGVVLVDPQPAAAQPVVITPGQAQVIFIRTIAQGWEDRFTHFAEDAQAAFEELLDEDGAPAEVELTEVAVGVPRDQHEYPARFVATAQIPFDGGAASVSALFDRTEADQPWLMTRLSWSTEFLLPTAVVDGDGWLAPPPPLTDLLVDPASLPERYVDWLLRAEEAKEVGSDELLTLPFRGTIERISELVPEPTEHGEGLSYLHTAEVAETHTDLVPFDNGTVHVAFTTIVHQVRFNRQVQRSGPCVDREIEVDGTLFRFQEWLEWDDDFGGPGGRFRQLEQDVLVTVEAWVPVLDAVAGPSPSPQPSSPGSPSPSPGSPSPSPGGPSPAPDPDDEPGLEPEPVDPARVVVEDWRSEFTNRDGEPC